MALTKQLTEEEWDLLAIIDDPILLGEFCRNTADGSPHKEEWPTRPWKYRWYQKDLLSDKSEFIVLTGGRAIGKCSPLFERVYIYPFGYVTIRDILGWDKKGHPLKNVTIYGVDSNNELVQRRLRVDKNGYKQTFKVKTTQGHIFEGTGNHPVMTPKGYVNIEDLYPGDQVGVATFLPHESQQSMFTWEELRWFGYTFGQDKVLPQGGIKVGFQRNILELQRLAKNFDARLVLNANGTYSLLRKRGPYKHYCTILLAKMGLNNVNIDGIWRIPFAIKAECLDNIKVFLESFISAYAKVAPDASNVVINHRHKTFAYDLQELLLRFSVESRVEQDGERWNIIIDEYQHVYQLFTSLDVPGVSSKHLKLPARLPTPAEHMRWDHVVSVEDAGIKPTFALYVPEIHNYISNNLFVHNSIVLEDRLVYEAVNAEKEFPNDTKEQVLVTPNMAQMTRLLDSKILRFSNSPLLKDFLRGNVNRSKGLLDFPLGSTMYKFFARIAGTKGENNMVSMHATKIKGDEMQIFAMSSFIQLGPGYNSWHVNASQLFAGVNYN